MDNNLQILDEHLYNILYKSIETLRADQESSLKSLYTKFQNKYQSMIDLSQSYLTKITSLQVGPLKARGNALNNTYFILEGQKAIAKLVSFTEATSQEELKNFLELQQIYEELVALILQLPMPTVLISYTNKNGQTYPLIEQDFNNYAEGVTNKMFFGRKSISKNNTIRLTQDFIKLQVEQKKKLIEGNVILKQNLLNLSNHMTFYSDTIQKYAKKEARQSIIAEAFYKHFYNTDYIQQADFYSEKTILYGLTQNNLPHFNGIGGMFILYHEAQGNDPTFTGQDVVTNFVNVQIKSLVEKQNGSMTSFDLAKISLIENFYLFVSQIMLDDQIDIDEAAKSAVLFFKQENRDITALEAIQKYGTEDALKIFQEELHALDIK